MPHRPDYDRLRAERGFNWNVSASYGTLVGMTGVPIREFFLRPEACIEVYQRGRPMVRERFGPDVALPAPATPPVSYGHGNGLGAPLLFPEGGEVGHEPIYRSLAEGIEALAKPVDFRSAGMAPFYIDFYHALQKAFPGETVGFGYTREGPLTTAYVVRGDEFFYDLMDEPVLVKEFLARLTESIIQFTHFMCDLLGHPRMNADAAGLCDDIAAVVPPALFPDLVLPFWEQYFQGLTTGQRYAHVENLSAEQLPFLEEIGLDGYDPSISPKLTPRLIAQHCRVPFQWRLPGFHLPWMSSRDIEEFIRQAAADGASGVTTDLHDCWDETVVDKIHTFIRVAREVKQMIDEGVPREQIATKSG